MRRSAALAILAALSLWGWRCTTTSGPTVPAYGQVLRHEAPHLDLKVDQQLMAQPGRTIHLTAFLRGEPIAAEWACSLEQWDFGDGQHATRAEDPCPGLERVYEHPHRYDAAGKYEAQLTLRSQKGHSLPSTAVTVYVGGHE